MWKCKSLNNARGGAGKNAKVDLVISLPAELQLRYKSDDSHAFDHGTAAADITFGVLPSIRI